MHKTAVVQYIEEVPLANNPLFERGFDRDSTVKLLWWKCDISQKQKCFQFLRIKLISKTAIKKKISSVYKPSAGK